MRRKPSFCPRKDMAVAEAKAMFAAGVDLAVDPGWRVDFRPDSCTAFVNGAYYDGRRGDQMIRWDVEGPYVVGSFGDRWRWRPSERRPAGDLLREEPGRGPFLRPPRDLVRRWR